MAKKKGKPKFKRLMMTQEDLKKFKPGPVRHEGLPPDKLVLAKLTYRAAGRFLYPTLEQWELGFMRDMNPDGELLIWLGISIAFRKYLDTHKGLDDESSGNIVGCIAALASGGSLTDPKDAPLQAELQGILAAMDGRPFREMCNELCVWVGDEGDSMLFEDDKPTGDSNAD